MYLVSSLSFLQRKRFSSSIADRTMTTFTPTAVVETLLTVHSSFRDELGKQVKPYGLEWHLDGDSKMTYAPISKEAAAVVNKLIQEDELVNGQNSQDTSNTNNQQRIQAWIVAAHNRWSFARDWPMRQVRDIQNIQWNSESSQFQVQWDPDVSQHYDAQRYTIAEMAGLLKMDKSAQGEEAPAKVWINGYHKGSLSPGTLDDIQQTVAAIPSRKLVYRKSPSGILRIERRFTGMIRGQEVFEHILDNLYALEDVQFVDPNNTNKLLGTATLPDWIMGGELTSRLWIHDELTTQGTITFLRPLYDDNIKTSDRRYVLKKGKDDERISIVQGELERLRYLATLPSPYQLYHSPRIVDGSQNGVESKSLESTKEETKVSAASSRRRNRRRFFGL